MHVVPNKIFGVSKLNMPGGSMHALVMRVNALSGGTRPVTTEEIAAALDETISRVDHGLNYAKRMGFVQQVKGRWIAG
ncbi:MAG: hypothetical protein RIC55_24700 [Pirellulaceae bacterium]